MLGSIAACYMLLLATDDLQSAVAAACRCVLRGWCWCLVLVFPVSCLLSAQLCCLMFESVWCLVFVLARICMIMVHGYVYFPVCVLCLCFFATAFPPRVVAKEHPIANCCTLV